MLCQFGQTRNGYVATAASSATSGYLVVPESFGQNEEPARDNKECTKKKRSFVPKVDIIDAIVLPSM